MLFVSDIFAVTFTVEREFDSSLADKNSKEFHQLAKTTCKQVNSELRF